MVSVPIAWTNAAIAWSLCATPIAFNKYSQSWPSTSAPVLPQASTCTEAPCLQVNYRYRYKVTAADFDRLVADLRAGRLNNEVPPHGVLARVRQHVRPERWAGTGAEAQSKVDAR